MGVLPVVVANPLNLPPVMFTCTLPTPPLVSVLSIPSARVFAGGFPVYAGPMLVSFQGITFGSFVQIPGVPLIGVINPTSAKVIASLLVPFVDLPVIRLGDSATITIPPGLLLMPGSPPVPNPSPIPFVISITNAGQIKVLA